MVSDASRPAAERLIEFERHPALGTG